MLQVVQSPVSTQQRQSANQPAQIDLEDFHTFLETRRAGCSNESEWKNLFSSPAFKQELTDQHQRVRKEQRFDAAMDLNDHYSPSCAVFPLNLALASVTHLSGNRQREALEMISYRAPEDTEVKLRAMVALGVPLSSKDATHFFHEIQRLKADGISPSFYN